MTARFAVAHHPDARELTDAQAVARFRDAGIARDAVVAERARHPLLSRLGDLIDRVRA